MTQGMDPNEAFKVWRDQSIDAWAKAMADYVNTDAFAQSLGQYLDSSLAAQGQFKQYSDQFFKTTLNGLNMPSRDDMTGLAERVTNIELRIDDLQYSMDRTLKELRASIDAQRANQAEALLGDLQAQLTRLNEQMAAQSVPTAEAAAGHAAPARPAAARPAAAKPAATRSTAKPATPATRASTTTTKRGGKA